MLVKVKNAIEDEKSIIAVVSDISRIKELENRETKLMSVFF